MHWNRLTVAVHRTFGLVLLSAAFALPLATRAADHGDTPVLVGAGRHDARLTDLYAFTNDADLVLIVCLDPAIPPGVSSYQFASDLEVKILIDTNSVVAFDQPSDVTTYGGTVVNPGSIQEDIALQITFGNDGTPRLSTTGLSPSAPARVTMFAGLRDDPFIRAPRTGRNVAAIVLQLPLSDVLSGQNTILVWATSKVEELSGPFQEMAGRALRSMFPENHAMNSLHPAEHQSTLGVPSDVLIFDTSQPAAYPNGRLLSDDVVDLVGDPRVLDNDAPFPDSNDRPFLSTFPYLAPAHGVNVPTVTAWGMGVLCLMLLVAAKIFEAGGRFESRSNAAAHS